MSLTEHIRNVAIIAHVDHGKGSSGGGFGQKTLKQACEEIGIEPEKAIEALKAADVEATGDMRIREMADQNNMRPGQIRQILENL